MQNRANIGKSIYKGICTSQDFLFDIRSTKHISASIFFFFDKQEAVASCHKEMQKLLSIFVIPDNDNT